MDTKIILEESHNNLFFNRLADAKPLMKELSLMGLSAVQKNIESNIKPDNAPLTKAVKKGSNTFRDTGNLKSSLTARHSDTSAEIGTACPYARVHNPDDGKSETVIKPKRAKYLCLPASPKTRTFFRRYGWSPREVIAGLESSGYSVYRPYKKGTSIRGNVIMAKKGKGKPEAIFILKRQVKIPARPFMYLEDKVIEAMSARVEQYYGA